MTRNTLHKTGKTVVLATNQLYFVQSADMVVFMSEGRIAESGSYPKLMAAGEHFATMMKEVQIEEEEKDSPFAATVGEITQSAVATSPVESDKVRLAKIHALVNRNAKYDDKSPPYMIILPT